ncbi:uncharacterized protein LOC117893206 [Drosophila subobscura]|uniref:uncharacterized protein LOC117893206 n=1 Tax=Drosophila subobscura TaxID=7241 RepID=UPI00155B26C2|nr:uncharacterized protein LOC117893206 [Drosophila subobscura]XP_034655623.1 uncharacterized protein LOC117893206 [Drosophila subobscura]
MSLTQSSCEQRSSGRNRKSSSSMLDDFDKASIVAHADDNEYISPATPEPQPETEFAHLTETKRKIHDAIAALNDDSYDKRIARLLPQYEGAIREEFEIAQYSPQRCRKLARILTGLTDVIHTIFRSVRQENAYRQRMCNIVAFYISCELCSAQEPVEKEEFIINRISSCLKFFVEYGNGGVGVHKEHVLRTLLAAPKLFNRASILSVLYSRLFSHWSMPSIMIQAELPDKLYIEYILIFYYWQRLEPDEAVKEKIVEFAEKFMRPSKTLATRSKYAEYLPKYSARGTATRSILNHLRQNSCTSLHMAIKVENRPPQSSEVVISSDDEDSCPLWSSVRSRTPTPSSSQLHPAFLQNLCKNARQLEPCERASALFSGIDNTIEIVDLRDSDDEVEMFSLDFNVPANVDGNNSNSNDSASQSIAEDYSVPVTRIYPTNLRTYERGPSATAISVSVPPTTYIVPRIVNSYSCRRDSLHLVSTTAPHLVDQSVQTTEDEEELEEQAQEKDALPMCPLCSDNRLPATTTTKTTDLLYSAHRKSHSHFQRSSSASSSEASNNQHQHVHHCHQPSSQNSNSSGNSMQKKQVTFSPQHLGVTFSRASVVSSKNPAIKRYETMAASKVDRIDTLKWMALKEHIQASAKMFAKLNANSNNCDKEKSGSYAAITKLPGNKASPVRSAPRAAQLTSSQLTPTTSNASSCTPTRMRATPRGRGELPTPPASTHSSASPYQILRASTDTLGSIDMEKLEVNARVYSFNRRLFSKAANEHVGFYNQLLSVQRKNLRQRRLANRTKNRNLVDPRQAELVNSARQRCLQLRALNASMRNEAEQLQNNLTAIKNYAMRHAKPIVRLKRCNLNFLARTVENSHRLSTSSMDPVNGSESDKEACGDNQQEQKQQQLDQSQVKQRRRRGHSVWKHIKKKKKIWLQAPDVASDTAPVEVQNPSPKSDRGSMTEPDSKDPDPMPMPASKEPKSQIPEIGMELEIQEDGLETDDSSAVPSPAHNIELVTSNVPVYLLNGESRDVSTPLSSQFSCSGFTEPAAASDSFGLSKKD